MALEWWQLPTALSLQGRDCHAVIHWCLLCLFGNSARNGHRTMVVAPKYKHYDGINFCGETRVRMKDQEARFLLSDSAYNESGLANTTT